jgi:cobalamin biosynthetic protein CobC
MESVRHGGALDRAIAKHGGRREDWLDLSTGVNPLGYPVPRMPDEVWNRLPDEELTRDCLDAARGYYGVPSSAAIAVAPGTQAIIQWLPVLYNFIDRVTIVSPTYGEYERAFRGVGAGVETPHDLPTLERVNPLLVFGQPNNPDGRAWASERLLPFIHGEGGVRAVIADEAFADVAPEMSMVCHAGETNLLVLRSFGKFFGLAGLRLGFAIGDPDVIESLQAMLGPWAASGPAMHLASVALRDSEWIATTRERLANDRLRLGGMLVSAGFEIVGGTDLFVLVRRQGAEAAAAALAQRHVLVRTFDHDPARIRFGLPGTDAEFERLERALGEIA